MKVVIITKAIGGGIKKLYGYGNNINIKPRTAAGGDGRTGDCGEGASSGGNNGRNDTKQAGCWGIYRAGTACRGRTGNAVRGRYAEQATGSGDVQRQGFRGVCDAGCLVTGRCGTAVCVPVIELVYQLRVQQGTAVLVPDIASLSRTGVSERGV